MGEPVAVALSFVVKKVVDQLLARLPTNSKKVNQAWRDMLDSAALEIDKAFKAFVEHQVRTNAEVASRIASALDEREAHALFIRLLPEAALATTRERMRLLAHALAGLHRPDLGSEMRSKVSRAVVQLEPNDVLELRKLDEDERQPGGHRIRMMTPELDPLVSAGCAVDDSMRVGRVPIRITALGRAVIATLEVWMPTGCA